MIGTRERQVRAACLAVVAICLAAVVVTASGIRAAAAAGPGPLDTGLAVGDVLDLPADLMSEAGRPTLLVFMESACPGSRAVAERLPAVRERMAAAGVQVVAAVSGTGGVTETAVATAAGFDPSGIWAVDFERLPLRAVPAFVFVNANGEVVGQRAGVIDDPRYDPFFASVSPIRP